MEKTKLQYKTNTPVVADNCIKPILDKLKACMKRMTIHAFVKCDFVFSKDVYLISLTKKIKGINYLTEGYFLYPNKLLLCREKDKFSEKDINKIVEYCKFKVDKIY